MILENMHDIPYVTKSAVGPEVTASMSVICSEVRRECPDLPIGVQVLAGCNTQALAVALAAGMIYIS